MNTYFREPVNGITHLIGAILSIIGYIALLSKTLSNDPSIINLVAISIFGISLILLYTASAVYHLVISSDDVINYLRRVDHAMIFLLIAGSYTPFCLIALDNSIGWSLFSLISLTAIIGIGFKLFWFKCPRWLSTSIYVVMGWVAIFLIKPLNASLSSEGLSLLILGGILYTIGAIIYATKPKFIKSKYFGFHEVFHIFIMLGSLAHFICVYIYVI